jgi:ribosomal protein S18 acetylase RimI-like enzyme
MADYALRPATPDDRDWLVELRLRTMDPHFVASGQLLTRADHEARVVHDYDCIDVVEVGGARAGIIKVVRDAPEWKLVQVQIEPGLQRHGLGTSVIEALLTEAHRHGVSVGLSVLKVNPARRLYERLGFSVVGESDHAYQMRIEPDGPRGADGS